MEPAQVEQLLTQVTRIADALQLQQELKLKELAQGPNQNSSCKPLIQAANRMGRSLNEITASVDAVNGGRLQSTQATAAAADRTAALNAASERELDDALSSLTTRPPNMVEEIVQGLAPRTASLPEERREALAEIERRLGRKAK